MIFTEKLTLDGGGEFGKKKSFLKRIDWYLLLFSIPIVVAGLVTMQSYGEGSVFFDKQAMWLAVSIFIFFLFSFIDISLLKNTKVLLIAFFACLSLLVFVLIGGHVAGGAKSWISLGSFSIQPSDFVILVLILMLAKYFSRRHVAIGQVKHLIVSGVYALIPFFLVFLQPDFGTAMVIGCVWFGMALISGIRKRHLLLLFGVGVIAFTILWAFVFRPYQKARIMSYINPVADIHGSGYNVRQAVIAVGSGQLFGKGVGYGTQSRLRFLPEYQTDFIFAAFSEEWGFVGALIILLLFVLLLGRIIYIGLHGAGNFEMLFSGGILIFFLTHIMVNVSMNMGLLPVTGITLPFMSYGGSHLITEFAALGILSSMRNYTRSTHPEDLTKEFEGL